MSLQKIILLSTLFIEQSSSQTDECPINKYPFIVAVRKMRMIERCEPEEYLDKFTYACGGSLIDKHWVVTAAYETTNPHFWYAVTAHLIPGPINKKTSIIDFRIEHEKFDKQKDGARVYNIALIHLKDPIEVEFYPILKNRAGMCKIAKVIHVQATNQPFNATAVCIDHQTADEDMCASSSPMHFERNNLYETNCLRISKDPKSDKECIAASGGVVICGSTLSGLVSYIMDCSDQSYIEYHTKIEIVYDFIIETVKHFEEDSAISRGHIFHFNTIIAFILTAICKIINQRQYSNV